MGIRTCHVIVFVLFLASIVSGDCGALGVFQDRGVDLNGGGRVISQFPVRSQGKCTKACCDDVQTNNCTLAVYESNSQCTLVDCNPASPCTTIILVGTTATYIGDKDNGFENFNLTDVLNITDETNLASQSSNERTNQSTNETTRKSTSGTVDISATITHSSSTSVVTITPEQLSTTTTSESFPSTVTSEQLSTTTTSEFPSTVTSEQLSTTTTPITTPESFPSTVTSGQLSTTTKTTTTTTSESFPSTVTSEVLSTTLSPSSQSSPPSLSTPFVFNTSTYISTNPPTISPINSSTVQSAPVILTSSTTVLPKPENTTIFSENTTLSTLNETNNDMSVEPVDLGIDKNETFTGNITLENGEKNLTAITTASVTTESDVEVANVSTATETPLPTTFSGTLQSVSSESSLTSTAPSTNTEWTTSSSSSSLTLPPTQSSSSAILTQWSSTTTASSPSSVSTISSSTTSTASSNWTSSYAWTNTTSSTPGNSQNGNDRFGGSGTQQIPQVAMSSELLVALSLGIVFTFAIIVLVGKTVFDAWQRRHYNKMDYLINGIYN